MTIVRYVDSRLISTKKESRKQSLECGYVVHSRTTLTQFAKDDL